MENRFRKLALALVFIFALAPTAASADEIPFLTWEQGQIQEVVLGGQAATDGWKVQLQGQGITPITFAQSSISSNGFLVYRISLPSDIPIGGYSIVTIDKSNKSKVVGGINVIASTGYKIAKQPLDLPLVIAILIFLTSVITTLRAKIYSKLTFVSTQNAPEESIHFTSHGANFFQRLLGAPYRIRVRAVYGLPDSVLRYLFLREGELLHRASHLLYGLLPIFGFLAGFVASNESQKAGGVAGTGMAIYIAITLISILDPFAGFAATLGFWGTQVAVGNISSLRDILVMIAMGIGWVGTPLIASVLTATIPRDHRQTNDRERRFAWLVLTLIASSLAGGAIFYFGQKLANSVLIQITPTREVSLLAFSIVVFGLIIRAIFDEIYLHADVGAHLKMEIHEESFSIARIGSPLLALGVFVTVYGFAYIWTQSTQRSLIVAALFSLPYFILLVRFEKLRSAGLAKARRFILLESVLVALISYMLFRKVSSLPLLGTERAQLFLILATLPGIAHAAYSIVCDSSQRQEIISA